MRRLKRSLNQAEVEMNRIVMGFQKVARYDNDKHCWTKATKEIRGELITKWNRYCKNHEIGEMGAMRVAINILECREILRSKYHAVTTMEIMADGVKKTNEPEDAAIMIIKSGKYQAG
jgi:hypothetical protein